MRYIAVAVFWLIAACIYAQTRPESASLLIEPRSDAMSDSKLLVDVGLTTPMGGVAPVLSKGCSLPCTATQLFEPRPGGTQITVKVARGGLDSPTSEVQLGTFRVTSASGQPLPRAVEIRFVAANDGIRISANRPSDAPALVIARIAP
jgi:hypothetical protein